MPVVLKLNDLMADRGISLNDLAEKVGITNVNLSRIKTGKIKAVRFSTLGMLCEVLQCQPGDILAYVPESQSEESESASEDEGPLDA